MKKVRNIILILLGVIVLLNILVAILLNIPFVQQKVLHIAVSELQKKINSEVSIEHIHLDLLRGVSLDKVYLEDQKGDTLLYVGYLSANTSIFSVYRNNTLTIDDVLLEDFKVYLSKDSTDSPLNFQFLVDAFSSKDTTEKDTTPSLFDLVIGNIELRNGEFRYDVLSQENTPGVFNASHIHTKNLNGRLALGSIQPDKFSGEAFRLAVQEESGLDLQNLKVQIHKDKKFIRLSGFHLDLPNSHLNMPDVWFDYQNTSPTDSLFIRNGIYYIEIEKSEIVPEDLRAFLPTLAGLSKPLKLEGKLNDTIPSLGVKKLDASYDKDIILSLSLSMSDWSDYRKSLYTADISQLSVSQEGAGMILRIASPETTLPDITKHLGTLQSQMKIKGTLDHFLINGNIETSPGKVHLKGNMGYVPEEKKFLANADVSSNIFDFNAILDTSLHIGKSGFDLHSDILISESKEPDIRIAGNIPFFTYQDYRYEQIGVNATYRGINDINAQLSINDENILLHLEGKAQQSGNNPTEYELQSSIRKFNPHNLHLTKDFENSKIETDIRLKIKGNKPEDMLGYLRLDSLLFATDSSAIRIDSILLTIDKTDNGNLLRLISPYLNVQAEGFYNPATIAQATQNILHDYLPTFFNYNSFPKNSEPNSFSYSVTLENTEELSAFFHLPVTLKGKSSIWGEFRDNAGEITLNAALPEFLYGKIPAKETTVFIGKKGNAYIADVNSNISLQNPIDLKLHTEIEKDTVMIDLKYDNTPAEFSFSGEIKTLLSFKREFPLNELIMTARFFPTDLILNDLHAGFEPAIITIKPGHIEINKFGLTQNNENFLGIDGIASASNADTLKVFFQKASIGNLLGGFDLSTIPVNGYLDGNINFSGLLGKPRFNTNAFKVDDITYQKDTIGSLTLNSQWSEEQKGMNVGVQLVRSKENISSANGFISPIQDLIRFDVNLQLLPVEIAQPFLKGIVHNLSGYCGANLKIDGKLSSPDILGYIYLKDLLATIDYTDVTYRISDTIRFTPTTMDIKNMKIYDNKNRSAKLNCSVKHKGFSDINYSGSIQMDNFLLVNNPQKTDSLFFGTFYANGNLTVRGDLKEAAISGNLRNGDNSTLKIRLPESAAQAKTYNSIVYLDEETSNPESKKSTAKPKFPIKANIAVELTKEAIFGLIINPATGDELGIRGSGNINMNYDSEMDGVKLFGQYTVDDGHLKLKLSQLPTTKSFTIRQGSRVNLNGDPLTSNFDITAVYRLRADLNTLDASFSTLGLSYTKVLVDCILQIQGNLNRLNLSYDITLPDTSDDINRMVNSIINTDDLRIKEFAYLLAFGSFFPPTPQVSTGSNSVATSLAASSLSSVLNGVLNGVLGKNWSVGTDVSSSQEDFSDIEMSVSVSTQLFNERLILNTNVGYRNAATVEESPWIGDFDLEYKLTKSGMIRARAYNHTNNEIFRSSNTIQGVGLVFTKEGRKFRDLFRFRKKKNPEEGQNTTNSSDK